MFKHIVLATDGSTSAERAARQAMALARIHGGQVTAVYVVDPYPYVGMASITPLGFEAYLAAAHEAAGRAFTQVSALAQAAGVPLQVRLVEDGHVVDGILSVADACAADVIVVGSHGHQGLKNWLLGSVADKVVAHAERTVLVVR
jgi:nucleotide-binding universal stress UspA family protein